MPPLETLVAFGLAIAIFAVVPGPGMVYATAQALARGRQGGLAAALGMHIGGYAHVIAATIGLAVLFQVVPPLYLALKLCGAAYLVWLGVAMIRGRASGTAEVPMAAPRRAFTQSVLVEVLNPKTALFFLAFLPQFVDPGAGLPIWAQLLILGVIANIVFSLSDVVCVLAAAQVAAIFRRSAQGARMARRAGGSILIGLGVHLAARPG